ncbi:F-box/LRR-repeat protein 25-like [Tasmannia lanceolata]|uniref:F-box/LRR-repeat protein 25-like n=1 Tax=Tasmannia lanceolata TaxID=3420 RepID=UPI004063ED19
MEYFDEISELPEHLLSNILSIFYDDFDHISEVSEPLLPYILSFCPTKDAVRTSILSSRWRSLWTYIHNLDFSFSMDASGIEGFVEFVDRSMSLHKGFKIQKFRLSFGYRERFAPNVNKWIRLALEKQVELLDLDFLGLPSSANIPHGIKLHHFFAFYSSANYYPNTFDLSTSFFHVGSSLKVLKLTHCILKSNSLDGLGSLKTLCLSHVRLNGSFLEFIAGCPMLEDLDLEDCDGIPHFQISSPNLQLKLKRLKIHTCIDFKIIEIDAPNLISLDISGLASSDRKFYLKNISALLHASLNLYYVFVEDSLEQGGSGYCLKTILGDVCHAKVLTI